eukprot:sb/3461742/
MKTPTRVRSGFCPCIRIMRLKNSRLVNSLIPYCHVLDFLTKCELTVLTGPSANRVHGNGTFATYNYQRGNKPKVRHAAQRSLASLSKSVATVCSLVVQSCTEKLDGYTGSKEAQVTLHTISFIRYILPQASEGELKQGMESILRVIALRHTKVTSAALQALASVCKQPSTAMTGQMQGQILMNLFSSKPSSFDHPITTVWLEALSACYTALATLEPKLGLIMAHNLFTFCSETVLSKNHDVVQISLVVMEQFFSENISPALECYQAEIEGKKSTPLCKVVSTLKTMLKLMQPPHQIEGAAENKPKVRHAAQRSLASLSKNVATVCSLVVQSCTEKLDGYTGSKEAQVTLHTISFIRYILPQASEGELKQGMESILRVIALRHTKVTSAALQALASVCKQPSTAMTGQMQGQILMNLFSSKPSSFDHPITTVWLEALSACYTALATLEPKLGLIMAHNLFTFCSETVLSKNHDVVQISLVVMEQFFSENISPALECYQAEIEGKKSTPLCKVVSTLKTMLKLTYQSVWDVDNVHGLGWLLPILRDHISHSELKFFVTNLVPSTSTLRAREETLKQKKGMELDWRVCFNLEYQIWALLPSFCRHPTDVTESFSMMAKTLGGLISSRPEIRELLCSALVTLIATVEEGERVVLAKFAKNFLPILFNLFLTEPKEHDPPRKPVKDAIESYLSICHKDTLHIFYEKILAKTQEEGMSDEAKRMVLELLVAMIAHLGEGDLTTTYDMVVPWLGDPGNPINQKRAYQILLALLVGKTEAHSAFVSTRLEELHTHLVESLVLAQPAAKKHRLKCLLALVRQLKAENFNFIPTILPEIVLCVKEQNEKTRLAAYKCLTAIGYIYLDKSEDKRAAMKDYFEMIIAGLTGSTHLAGATLLCLSKIVYEYNSYLDADILDQVVEIVAAMMSCHINSLITFLKAMLLKLIGTSNYRRLLE